MGAIEEIDRKLDDLKNYFNGLFPEYFSQEFRHINHKLERLEQLQMANQTDIDALTSEVTSLDQAASDGFTAIATEVQNLVSAQTSGNPVDLSALQAAVGKAQSDVSAGISNVTGLVPAATDTSGLDTSGTDSAPTGTTTDSGSTPDSGEGSASA